MAVVGYHVRALAVKGKNGYGHAECVLAKARQLGYTTSMACRKRGDLGKLSFLQQDTGFPALG